MAKHLMGGKSDSPYSGHHDEYVNIAAEDAYVKELQLLQGGLPAMSGAEMLL